MASLFLSYNQLPFIVDIEGFLVVLHAITNFKIVCVWIDEATTLTALGMFRWMLHESSVVGVFLGLSYKLLLGLSFGFYSQTYHSQVLDLLR